MVGVLKGDTVLLEQREGSQFYNRGNYGYPVKRDFELDLIEACYLMECGRLNVSDDGKDMT
ncbi:MAG: tRNA-intron lyase, partial [Candidatus Methanomethylophilaceae archaeon]|nr:tRNA-intron lyase [Candidatus Methanomethylophilaceae archaeon]